MDILFRSIARAGGFEVDPTASAAPPRPAARHRVRAMAARGLRLAGLALRRAGRGAAEQAGERPDDDGEAVTKEVARSTAARSRTAPLLRGRANRAIP